MKKENPFNSFTLISILIGAIIGSGLFHLPQNFALCGAPSAGLASWILTGIGIAAMSRIYLRLHALSDQTNPLNLADSIYHTFGRSISLFCNWGYWCSAWIGNSAYLLLIGDALQQAAGIHVPYPILTNLLALLCLLGAHCLILKKTKTLTWLHNALSLLKMVLVLSAVSIMLKQFNPALFFKDFWGIESLVTQSDSPVLNWFAFTKKAFSITLWCFLGFEGAILLAKEVPHRQVKRVIRTGLVLSWLVYLLVSLLPWGILPKEQLLKLPSPSIAGIIGPYLGAYGVPIIAASIALFSLGSLLAWSAFATEIAAKLINELFQFEKKENSHVSQIAGIWATSIASLILLMLSALCNLPYAHLAEVAALAMLPFYGFSLASSWPKRDLQSRWIPVDMGVSFLFLLCVALSANRSDWLLLSFFFAPLGLIFIISNERRFVLNPSKIKQWLKKCHPI